MTPTPATDKRRIYYILTKTPDSPPQPAFIGAFRNAPQHDSLIKFNLLGDHNTSTYLSVPETETQALKESLLIPTAVPEDQFFPGTSIFVNPDGTTTTLQTPTVISNRESPVSLYSQIN